MTPFEIQPVLAMRGGSMISMSFTPPAAKRKFADKVQTAVPPPEGFIMPEILPADFSLAKPGDALCSICEKLQLTPRRFVLIKGEDEDADRDEMMVERGEIALGRVGDMKKKKHCPLCRLVLVALGPGIRSFEDGVIKMSWNVDGFYINGSYAPQIRILRPSAEGDAIGGVGEGLNFFPEITILANDAPKRFKQLLPRLVPDQIDFAVVRNWLLMCDTAHGYRCERPQFGEALGETMEDPAVDILDFRLIDTARNCIMLASGLRECKYVTLSYVWGKLDMHLETTTQNLAELEKPGALLKPEYLRQIPMTIQDAMQVVRQLGLRYLWVDSLCIVQDDVGPGGSKLGQIAKMDIVYSASYLTIVAGSGDNANVGLPGVRLGTRGVGQPVEELAPGFRLGFKQKLQDYIPGTVYYTRGWTYQEQRFARRSLTFIGGQVVYQCQGNEQWREDVVCEELCGRDDFSQDKGDDLADIGSIEGTIQSYVPLSLTNETDLYHAFAGLTRTLKRLYGLILVHGMPDAYFDWYLLWDSLKAPQKRRNIAPSWTWAGWYGESWSHIWDWYSRRIPKIRAALKQRTWIIWYQRKANDSEEFIRVWTPKGQIEGQTNFYGGPIQNRFPVDCSQTRPTPRKLKDGPKYLEDSHNPRPGSGILQFWTISLFFDLSEPTSRDSRKEYQLEDDKRTRAGMFGRDGEEIGTVLVDPAWYATHVPGRHEFILLCEGRDTRPEDGQEDGKKGWLYKAMLLEWHGEWAERVAIASIRKKKLTQALDPGLQWKEIILG
ncbi:hypothetical protein M422DRAFT_230080 [Sphaerobolus stellatus SS14]|uniref:Heterokaryon incompatibility domain-containing protein n=1 Tax=Sphaerobolus stellatus (strain SS14) TaxID=990650 RepID=A0A0C9VQY4_SPHS4|nr:hypothetical protein M422DRAFT_230080 [Sphaerobolus stellatus SS14]